MTTSLGILNSGLDEAIRNEIGNYKATGILMKAVSADNLLPGEGRYFVLTMVRGHKRNRRFISIYDGNNIFEFLSNVRLKLDEMFGCPVETYVGGTLFYV